MPSPNRFAAIQQIARRPPLFPRQRVESLESLWARDVFTLAQMQGCLPKAALKLI